MNSSNRVRVDARDAHVLVNATDQEVVFRVINRVAVIALNRPSALNALSHSMVQRLANLVEHCRTDDGIAAIVFLGLGERAFCAGGDVRALYWQAKRSESGWQQFFVDEYRLDYALHTFPKPVVALLDGITMGGGMGLGQGACLRIVTERSRLAMPETRIGLLPDVGATRFLNSMPPEVALYLGLTGASVSGADALNLKLADLCVPSDWLATFEERLRRMSPVVSGADLLSALRSVFRPPNNIIPHAPLGDTAQWIMRHFDWRSGVERIVSSLRQALDRAPPREARQWLQETLSALTSHSPTMLCVTREALLRGRQMTIAECFRMELGIVVRAIEEGDFCEGVRAHFIEKDHRPRWAPMTLAEVRQERVRYLLSSPWRSGEHPLAELGLRRNDCVAGALNR